MPLSVCDGIRAMLRGLDDRFASIRCKDEVSSAVTIPHFKSCHVGSGPGKIQRHPGFACPNDDFAASESEKGLEAVRRLLDPCFGKEWSREPNVWRLTGATSGRYCDLDTYEAVDSFDPNLLRAVVVFRCRDENLLPDGGIASDAAGP
jgi:hypothetical protein